MNHTIVLATLEHALALLPRLRKADLQEIAAASGDKPEDALVLSLASSRLAWAWLYKGRVMAMFGVADYPGRDGVGIPWLLGARGVDKHKVYFVRQSRKYLDQMLAPYGELVNWVDSRNTSSIQWLAWCGFVPAEVRPFFGVQRLPFIRFSLTRRRSNV